LALSVEDYLSKGLQKPFLVMFREKTLLVSYNFIKYNKMMLCAFG